MESEKIILELLMILFMVMVITCFSQADENLTWKIEKKASQYGEDLHLSCQVENCCTKSAGWGKWTSDDQFNTIFIDVKDFHNDGSLKYGGGTDKKGWFLIIRNITKHDFNISYSCTYGFQVSKKKMLLKEDAFSGKHAIMPDAFSIDGKQDFLKKISPLMYIFGAVAVFTVVGNIIVHYTKKFRNNNDKASSHSLAQSPDRSEIPLLKISDNVLLRKENCSNDSGIIAAAGHTIGQSADLIEIRQEISLLETADNVHSLMENCSDDRGMIEDLPPNSCSRRRRNTNSCNEQKIIISRNST